MDAEIRFFMTIEDEEKFLSFAKKHIDEVLQTDTLMQRFSVGDCELLFTPTLAEGTTLYSGVLEIRIDATNDNACKNQMRANMSYKKLRNWIKKNYWSRLAYINKQKNDQLMPSRIHWLAPEAKQWKESDPKNHMLKLSKTSWMVFDIGF
ncbi:MAG: hypothetical protein V3V19_05050 [Cocleimonas sp.]